MTINLQRPDITELKPRITVFGVGGGGGNAVNNMINAGLQGVDFVVANTDAQALTMSKAERVIQLGAAVTEGLGAGALPEVGQAAADECLDEIIDHLSNSHMAFITAGMGGGTGTGAAPVVARAAREKGILTVGVVTKPFHFEGARRMKTAEAGIEELQKCVDTLIVIPNQNLFRIATEKTTFADAFAMADQVLYSGVASITDLMIKEGLINLDFADVRSVMHEMGRAMMGTGEASGEGRALAAAEAAIANPLLDETSMRGARGLLISITGGRDMTLYEVDEAANRIRQEVDEDANVIFGAIDDDSLEGVVRVSVVATGIDRVESDVAPSSDYGMRRPAAPARKPMSAGEVGAAQSAVTPQSRSPQQMARPESMIEVMEALEVEIARPVDEPFRPKSQIFKTPVQPQAPIAPHGQVGSGMRAQARSVPQQPLASAVHMEATARVLEESPSLALPEQNVQTPRVAPQQEARPTAVRVPSLEDFPSVARQHIHAGEEMQKNIPQGPRNLWQKLTQSWVHRDEVEETARLEPAVRTLQSAAQAPQASEASLYVSRAGSAQLRAQARVPLSEEEQLEIPAFLRRQAN
ncbi:cell division protein FtsZ [Bartonella sp. DGB2]|uniref:cell division protein FtsZ n=1 Tax=Bartonella sp. DGB2 TaxID=3388426 RepID=UPI00398F8EF4